MPLQKDLIWTHTEFPIWNDPSKLSKIDEIFPGLWTFLVAQMVKNPPANAGDTKDTDLVPGLGRSPGEGNSSPVQYSCLENPMDRGDWWATVHGVAKKSVTSELLTVPGLYMLVLINHLTWVALSKETWTWVIWFSLTKGSFWRGIQNRL